MSQKNQKNTNKSKKRPFRWLRRLLRTFGILILFLILLLLFIRSHWGQNIIKDKLISYLSDKTETKIELDKLFITFEGNLQIDGFYLEDKKGDTLVYSRHLEANLPLWQTITDQAYGVDNIKWQGLKVRVTRQDSISGFNFQFLIDAFSSEKDTTRTKENKGSISLIIGDVNLKDFDIKYTDQVSKIDSELDIGRLNLEMKSTDVEHMIFEAKEFALDNTQIKFHLNSTAKNEDSDSSTLLPKLSFGQINLKDIKTDIEVPDLKIRSSIVEFYTEIPILDLSQEQYIFNTVQFSNSEVSVNIYNDKNIAQNSEDKAFAWPKPELEIPKIVLENNSFNYSLNDAKPNKNKFDPDAIAIENFSLDLENFTFKERSVELQVNQLGFDSNPDIKLKKLKGRMSLSDEQILLKGLELNLDRHIIKGMTELKYSDFKTFIEKPEEVKFKSDITTLKLALQDLLKFQPDLKENPYVKTISKKQLTGKIKVSGTLANLQIPEFQMNWGENTKISATASVQNITVIDSIKFDAPNYMVSTQRTDILNFVDEAQLSICLPERFLLQGNFSGKKDSFFTSSQLESSQGLVFLEGKVDLEANVNFSSTLEVKEYKIDELLDNPALGKLSLRLKSSGSGQSLERLDAEADLYVSRLDFNDYSYENLSLNGFLKNGKGEFTSNYKDDNLNYTLNSTIELDTLTTKATLNLGMKGVNLNALGFVKRNIKTGFDLKFDFCKSDSVYNFISNLENGVVVYENRSYILGDLDAEAFISKDTTDVNIKNKILSLNLKANSSPGEFGQSLSQYLGNYFQSDNKISDSTSKPISVKINGKISQSRLLNEVMLVNAKDVDTIDFSLNFDEKQKTLITHLTAPHINYSGNEIDSLKLSLQADEKNLKFDFGFKAVNAGPFNIPRTSITGIKENELFHLKFKAEKENKLLYYLKSNLSNANDRIQFSVDSDSLLLNGKKWLISQKNKAFLKSDSLVFENFEIKKGDQLLKISDAFEDISKSHLGLEFKNFNLNEILNYFNPEEQLVKGNLNGNFIIEEPLNDTGIVAKMNISQLEILDAYLGKLDFNGRSIDGNNYDFDAKIREGNVNLDLQGAYSSSGENPNLDLKINLNEIKVKALENLSFNTISEGTGSLSGKFNFKTRGEETIYTGALAFNKAGFKVNMLNTSFMLPAESLEIDDQGLKFDDFSIRDAKDNLFSVSGEIRTDRIINPEFDLNFKADDFKVLDAGIEDNSSFYGKAVIDAEGTLKGDLEIPDLDAKFKVGSETDFVYVLPQSTASIEKREGVIRFVNRENPDDILTKNTVKSGSITGFDINALLKVDKSAKFTVILDENSEDSFEVQGEGDLNFQMFTNGRINLSGIFEASSGQYKLNLYNLVKRKFTLAPGSRLTWNGDPFNAKLDVRAIYNIKTSAYSLMSPQISGLDPSLKSKYRQVLPFNVYLDIDGELMQPEISFELDMPEDERGAISGQVYSRIKQVNQQEAELSQQVFSLLVLNRFYPDGSNDGSSGGIQTLAQDNINDAISDQLNAFSNKILGNSGFELDFGLDSYTNYQGDSPSQTTQLNVAAQKKLFNDRLTVRVGSEIDIDDNSASGNPAPVTGNVSLIYQLTKDGRYTLKGFRRNRFENIIDGQTIVSGIALIFTKEFNKFDELWKAMLESSKNKSDEKNEKRNKSSNTQSN